MTVPYVPRHVNDCDDTCESTMCPALSVDEYDCVGIRESTVYAAS